MHPDDAVNVTNFWRAGEMAYRRDLLTEDELGELELEERRQKDVRTVLDMPFSHGTLAFNSAEPNAFDDYLDSLGEVAAVLSEGFRRLDDLQALKERTLAAEEAQARIEAEMKVGQAIQIVRDAADFNSPYWQCGEVYGSRSRKTLGA